MIEQGWGQRWHYHASAYHPVSFLPLPSGALLDHTFGRMVHHSLPYSECGAFSGLCPLGCPVAAGLPHVKPTNWVKVEWSTVQWLPFLNVMFW